MKVIKKCLFILILMSVFVMTGGWLFQLRSVAVVPEQVEASIGIPYKVESIPLSNKRPKIKRRVSYIVIHNTANETSTAQNERDYLVNAHNASSTSFHIAIDDKEAIEAVPLNEIAFHAGSKEGNTHGIGIEICESGDFTKTRSNAARLVAYLLKYYDLPMSAIRTHFDFSGKECPRKLLGDFETFKLEIKTAYQAL